MEYNYCNCSSAFSVEKQVQSGGTIRYAIYVGRCLQGVITETNDEMAQLIEESLNRSVSIQQLPIGRYYCGGLSDFNRRVIDAFIAERIFQYKRSVVPPDSHGEYGGGEFLVPPHNMYRLPD